MGSEIRRIRRTLVICSGLDRVEGIGNGLAQFVFYRNVKMPDGSIARRDAGNVLAPLEAVPEAIDLMFHGIVDAGMYQAALAIRRYLGRPLH